MGNTQKHIKKGQVLALMASAVSFALIAAFCVLYFGFQIPILDRSGWITSQNGACQYLDYYGRPLKQWQELDGNRYYFHPDSGNMITGWMETQEGTFYLSPTGQMQTGFVEVADERYYLQENGVMGVGWLDTPEGRCYGGEEGKLASGWLQLVETRYYLDENGFAVSGWQELDGVSYYFSDTGSVVTGWLTLEEGTYYLKPEGGVHTGWLEEKGDKYWFGEDGILYTGWLNLPEGRYYLKEDGVCSTGIVTVDDIERYFTQSGEYVPLVNPWNEVPEDYVLNLVEIDEYLLDEVCVDPLGQMLSDCEAAGYDCGINSAYRSMEKQQQLWDERYEEYLAVGYSSESAKEQTGREVAIPGTSEHHLGLAVDISGYADTYAWLEEHSWEYGFIRRYPDEKLDVTGIVYEPWHYRYVGKTLAQEIYKSGLCLEEYLEKQN